MKFFAPVPGHAALHNTSASSLTSNKITQKCTTYKCTYYSTNFQIGLQNCVLKVQTTMRSDHHVSACCVQFCVYVHSSILFRVLLFLQPSISLPFPHPFQCALHILLPQFLPSLHFSSIKSTLPFSPHFHCPSSPHPSALLGSNSHRRNHGYKDCTAIGVRSPWGGVDCERGSL